MTIQTDSLSPEGNNLREHILSLSEKGELDLPLLPEVAQRVVQLTNCEDSDAAELAKVIQSDPSLAAHVMKVANSAAFTPNASLVSLQQAIARLGMNLIGDIAIATCLNGNLFHTPGFEQRIEDLWNHALVTGLWAREVSRYNRLNVEAAFLGGLLHSIGRAVALHEICTCAEKLSYTLIEADVITLEEQLQDSLARQVLDQWQMPQVLKETVAYWSNYQAAPKARQLACIVNVSASLASCTLDSSCVINDELEGVAAFTDLNMYPEDIDAVLQKSDQVTSSLEAYRR